MGKAGVWLVWIGIALTAIGLVAGFGAMFVDLDRWAMFLLGLVPFGFVALMLGVMMSLFGRAE